ncbi:MAG TPA: hypothetical protein VFM69_06065 [Pricia sp.]|nr:hypothetical protein [Pricia sp.]
MKPLLVLTIVFIISVFAIRLVQGTYEIALAGRIAMSVMLLFTAMGHFKFDAGMSMMLPDFVPYKMKMVHLTGIFEIAAATGLLLPNFKVVTGWLLIVFFILVLPANVYAAMNHIDYQKATFNGPGLTYLWFRIPLQLLFILWVYVSSIKY